MKIKLSLMWVLAALFVLLKISGILDWDWLWVVSPLWVPSAVVGTLIGVMASISIMFSIIGGG